MRDADTILQKSFVGKIDFPLAVVFEFLVVVSVDLVVFDAIPAASALDGEIRSRDHETRNNEQ
jgi:hypothetical protein